MAEPAKKAPGIDALLSDLMGRDRGATIRSNKCMTCGGDANDFKDALSVKEYGISGMCQRCQDSVFESADEDEEDLLPASFRTIRPFPEEP